MLCSDRAVVSGRGFLSPSCGSDGVKWGYATDLHQGAGRAYHRSRGSVRNSDTLLILGKQWTTRGAGVAELAPLRSDASGINDDHNEMCSPITLRATYFHHNTNKSHVACW